MNLSIPIFGCIVLVPLGAAAPVALQQPKPEQDIVVLGRRSPIVVDGHSIRCQPRPNSPEDAWMAGHPDAGQDRRQSVLVPGRHGQGFELVGDDGVVGGEGVWRRAGSRIDQYVFRTPAATPLLCIGSKLDHPTGYGQLRMVVPAAKFAHKRLRLTAWVASSNVGSVGFWLDALDPTQPWGDGIAGGHLLKQNSDSPNAGVIYNSGNVSHILSGSHGWTPILLEIGPISKQATVVNFGFIVAGGGDAWVFKPQLQAVAANDPHDPWGKGKVIAIGDSGARSDRSGDASR